MLTNALQAPLAVTVNAVHPYTCTEPVALCFAVTLRGDASVRVLPNMSRAWMSAVRNGRSGHKVSVERAPVTLVTV